MEALAGVAIVLILVFLRMQVGIAFAVVGLAGLILTVSVEEATTALVDGVWRTSTSHTLMALPLFTIMGQFASASGIGLGLYDAALKWCGRLPGGLAVATVWSCAFFGALTGRSQTGVRTFLPIAYRPMLELKYDTRLALGSVVAASTMGAMIPPSNFFIIYGFITETPVSRLFMGGVIPGLLEAILYSMTIVLLAGLGIWPGPPGPAFRWQEKIAGLKGVVGMLSLVLWVIGGIFLGWFTPTEAGAIGGVGAFALFIADRGFDRRVIAQCLRESLTVTCAAFVVIIGAAVFARYLAVAGLSPALDDWVRATELSPWIAFLLFLLVFFVLGMVMPAIPIILLVVPIVFPVFVGTYGFDPVWFGILVVLMCEIAFITPPVAVNLDAAVELIKGMAAKGEVEPVSDQTLVASVTPFVSADLLRLWLVVAFPMLGLWLPSHMIGQ